MHVRELRVMSISSALAPRAGSLVKVQPSCHGASSVKSASLRRAAGTLWRNGPPQSQPVFWLWNSENA
jgi:hypothetical protein